MSYSAKRSSFGQRVQGYNTRRSESSGGGRGGGLSIRWRHRWAPPVGVTTQAILLPGNYLNMEGEETEYFPYVDHFAARSNRGFICSKKYQIVDGELTSVGGKCLGCKEREGGADDIRWSMKHAFNVLHLAWYHKVPAEDEHGRPIKYTKGKRTGEQIMNDEICEGRRCPHCAAKLDKFFGRKVHWSIGSGHMSELAGIVSEIEKDCKSCGEGRLETVSYECDKCGFPLIDMQTTEMKLEDILSFVARKRECPKCGNVAIPLKQVECDHCQDPKPLSIFDCELEIKRQGEGTNSTVQVPRWTAIDIMSYKDKVDDFEEKIKPFVFKKIFCSDPFDIQAKILKIKNPWGSENPDADKHAKGYEEGEGGEGEEGDPDYNE